MTLSPKGMAIGAAVVVALWALVIWTESSQDLSTWQLLKERAANKPGPFWGSIVAGAFVLPRIL
jgi:hypothetical protein